MSVLLSILYIIRNKTVNNLDCISPFVYRLIILLTLQILFYIVIIKFCTILNQLFYASGNKYSDIFGFTDLNYLINWLSTSLRLISVILCSFFLCKKSERSLRALWDRRISKIGCFLRLSYQHAELVIEAHTRKPVTDYLQTHVGGVLVSQCRIKAIQEDTMLGLFNDNNSCILYFHQMALGHVLKGPLGMRHFQCFQFWKFNLYEAL